MSKSDVIQATERPRNSSDITSTKHVVAKAKAQRGLIATGSIAFVAVALVLGGLYQSFVNPNQSKDLWVVVIPLISAAISALVALGLGQKQQE